MPAKLLIADPSASSGGGATTATLNVADQMNLIADTLARLETGLAAANANIRVLTVDNANFVRYTKPRTLLLRRFPEKLYNCRFCKLIESPS